MENNLHLRTYVNAYLQVYTYVLLNNTSEHKAHFLLTIFMVFFRWLPIVKFLEIIQLSPSLALTSIWSSPFSFFLFNTKSPSDQKGHYQHVEKLTWYAKYFFLRLNMLYLKSSSIKLFIMSISEIVMLSLLKLGIMHYRTFTVQPVLRPW